MYDGIFHSQTLLTPCRAFLQSSYCAESLGVFWQMVCNKGSKRTNLKEILLQAQSHIKYQHLLKAVGRSEMEQTFSGSKSLWIYKYKPQSPQRDTDWIWVREERTKAEQERGRHSGNRILWRQRQRETEEQKHLKKEWSEICWEYLVMI